MTTDRDERLKDVALFILSADEREMNLIQQSFKARRHVMEEERRLMMLSNIYVGTRVYLNGNCSPQMLQWKYAKVERIIEKGFLVKLETPPSDKWRGLIQVTLNQIELP